MYMYIHVRERVNTRYSLCFCCTFTQFDVHVYMYMYVSFTEIVSSATGQQLSQEVMKPQLHVYIHVNVCHVYHPSICIHVHVHV